MGWCSGTEIFDPVVKAILAQPADQMTRQVKKAIIKPLIKALGDQDWDCESDSDYFSNKLVQECFKEVCEENGWYGGDCEDRG